jgi:hypothetical protein
MTAASAKSGFREIAGSNVVDDHLNIYRGLGVSMMSDGYLGEFAILTVIFC